ncbi:glucose sensor KNAG_0B02810 [Huiozyma naganishii CBS 8797]|uniref:Major facilitator superfamily (MFS) profile domain-containing protein n=1 Tax=Huiozyma naganishii (strain ATCC MYA-139 / BCRC 22969 / CBS 8797 / KCTC 17520 / NBRC 10181 / NCYC 3082 / Yp74L-3) TaxID=1071383 RepID=J7RGQ5_HUIN7|nr:hypothetical protein KNAG_0B02810 [Kazachstania naganishii CBS 8797]CCK68723.1 hypothetical protein KNAG_0B02810 [Kazachstania naganishii CBS 8797]
MDGERNSSDENHTVEPSSTSDSESTPRLQKKAGLFDTAIRKLSNSLLVRRKRSANVEPKSEESAAQSNTIQSIVGAAASLDTYVNGSETSAVGDNDQVTLDAASLLFSEPPRKQSNMMSLLVGIFVAVGGFLFGYDTGLINSIAEMNYVKEHLTPNRNAFTTKEMAIVVSFLSMGTFVGALMAPFLSDSWGRKKTIIASTVVIFSVGNSLQVGAASMTLLVVGRVVSGLAIGVISAVVPLYQAEAAKKELRGAIISTYQWAITWGLLVSSAISQGTYKRNDPSSYRIPIGLQYVWSTILAVGMCFLPESPRYFVLKDDLDCAAKSLAFLRGVPVHDSGLLEELVEIKATFDYERSIGSSSFLDCFISSKKRPKQTLRMFTGIAIQAFQQFSGINFIFYYGINFFRKSGIQNSYIISFITYAVNVAFSIPGLFLVDHLGRRKVLIYGGIGMTVSNFIVAIVGVSTNSVVSSNVTIAFICVFIASFSATWGGAVWVISAELYSLGVRAKCTAICAASNWLVNFACAFMTPYIVNRRTKDSSSMGAKIYFIWGSLNALGLLVVYLTVYETKGLRLEQIDELYKNSPNSRASTKWNKIIRGQGPLNKIFEMSSGDSSETNTPGASLNETNTSKYQNQSHINETGFTMDDLSRYEVGNEDRSVPLVTAAPSSPTVVDTATTLTSAEQLPRMNSTSISLVQSSVPSTSNFIDLGNGLRLNTYRRGPPSISSESNEDEGSLQEYDGPILTPHSSDYRHHMDMINGYLSHTVDQSSNSNSQLSSNGTHIFMDNGLSLPLRSSHPQY